MISASPARARADELGKRKEKEVGEPVTQRSGLRSPPPSDRAVTERGAHRGKNLNTVAV